ncbi:hypothetical protein [Brevundimonas sp. DWR2-3-1b1]|uniref:hypothetical protein n=1 Tax=unclassified Brevundimonas TaxID=2622653 RepID=UPI003CF8823F
MLYRNNSQGYLETMGQGRLEQDVARELQGVVWSEVHRVFEVRRREKGLSQAELARRIGLQRERVHYWMSRPERMTLAAAARLLAGMDARLECRGRMGEVDVTARP